MKKIILISLLVPIVAQSAFEENGRRYLSSVDIFAAIQFVFGYTGPNKCQQDVFYGRDPLTGLGQNNVVTGEPVSPAPSQGTVQMISTCLDRMWEVLREKYPARDQLEAFVLAVPPEQASSILNNTESYLIRWNSLSLEVRQLIVRNHVFNILGSDERILDYGLIQEPEQFRAMLVKRLSRDPNLTVRDAVVLLVRTLILRDEFLSF